MMRLFLRQIYNVISTPTNIPTIIPHKGKPVPRILAQYTNQKGFVAVPLDLATNVSLLHACTNLKELKQSHAHMLKNGLEQNIFLGTKLVNMYNMFDSLVDAQLVFDKLLIRNVFIWNALIRGYVRNELPVEALAFYCQMLREGIQPDNFTFPCVLKACADILSLQRGKGIHDHAADKFNHYKKTCPSVGNIGVITVHQSTKETITSTITADREEHKSKSTGRSQIQAGNRPCTIIRDISTLCSEGRLAVALLHVMDQQDTPVDSNIYVSLLQACTDMKALAEGKQVHEHMVVSGVSRDVFLRSKLLHMYVKCGSLADARLVFDELPKRNVFFWNMMIRGYASNGFYEETLALYNQMQLDGMHADHFTFPFVLKACASIRDLEQGKEIHDCVKETGLESNVFVGSALVDMYAKCGSLENARQVFDKISQRNNVTWNAMISGYAQSGHCEVTFKLLCQMQQAGEKPNVVTWNAVISGYSQNGYHDEALKIFRQMQMIPVKPNSVTMTSVLPSCANSANLQQGKELHGYIIRNGLDSEGIVGCALVTMYSKCESIGDGRRIFDNMSQSIVPSWNAMIAGYAQNGCFNEALEVLHQMQMESRQLVPYVTIF